MYQGSLATLKLVADEVSRNPSAIDAALPQLSFKVDSAMTGLVSTAARFARKCHRGNKRLCVRDLERAVKLEYGESPTYFLSESTKAVEIKNSDPPLLCLHEPELNLKDFLSQDNNSKKIPLVPTFTIHWLAVEGNQPLVPENDAVKDPVTKLVTSSNKKKTNESSVSDDSATLTRELSLYLDKVLLTLFEAERGVAEQEKARSVFASLANDAGIDRLVPHFVRFISNRIAQDIEDLQGNFTCVRIAECLVLNENLKNVDFYLHELLPSLLTCVVSKSLSKTPAEDHWGLRDLAAKVCSRVCARFGNFYVDLQHRVMKTFQQALCEENKPLTTRYGGIVGVLHLGPLAVQSVLVPFLKSSGFLQKLEKVMQGEDYSQVENDKVLVKRMEALRCLKACQQSLVKIEDSHIKAELLEATGFEAFSEDRSLYFL